MRAKKIDGNQTDIVQGLRKVGYSVAITSAAGDGFPDIVVGAKGKNYLFEIKDPAKPPSHRRLTPKQVKFHRDWWGQISVIETIDDALAVLA